MQYALTWLNLCRTTCHAYVLSMYTPDVTARRNTIANALELVKITKGKVGGTDIPWLFVLSWSLNLAVFLTQNIIVSSQAEKVRISTTHPEVDTMKCIQFHLHHICICVGIRHTSSRGCHQFVSKINNYCALQPDRGCMQRLCLPHGPALMFVIF